jgi:hypothetical protein
VNYALALLLNLATVARCNRVTVRWLRQATVKEDDVMIPVVSFICGYAVGLIGVIVVAWFTEGKEQEYKRVYGRSVR